MKSGVKLRRVHGGSWKTFVYGGASESVWLRRVYRGSYKNPFLFEVVKASKLEDVSHEMLVFRLPHVSS